MVAAEAAAPRRPQPRENRVRPPRCEHISGQEEDRDWVARCRGRASQHVRRAGTDRGRAGERREAVAHLREARRGVDHPLLVARLVVGDQLGGLRERLPDAGETAMAEDAETAFYKPMIGAVTLQILSSQKADERLRHP